MSGGRVAPILLLIIIIMPVILALHPEAGEPLVVAEYTGRSGPLLVFAAGPLLLGKCSLTSNDKYYVAVLDPSNYTARVEVWQDHMRINITLTLSLYEASWNKPRKACETTVNISDTIPLDAPLYLSSGIPAPVPPFIAWRIGDDAFVLTKLSINAMVMRKYSKDKAREVASIFEKAVNEAGIRGASVRVTQSQDTYYVKVLLSGYNETFEAAGHYILISPPPGEEYRHNSLFFPSTETGLNTHKEMVASAVYTGETSRAAVVLDGSKLYIVEELNESLAVYAVFDNIAGHPLLRLDKYLYHWPSLMLLRADIRMLDWNILNLLFIPTPSMREKLVDPKMLSLSPSKTARIIVTDSANLTKTIRLYTGDQRRRSINISQTVIDQLTESIRNPYRNVTVYLTDIAIAREPPTLNIGSPGLIDRIWAPAIPISVVVSVIIIIITTRRSVPT